MIITDKLRFTFSVGRFFTRRRYRPFLFADRSFRFENFFWKIIFTIGVVSDKLTKELFLKIKET